MFRTFSYIAIIAVITFLLIHVTSSSSHSQLPPTTVEGFDSLVNPMRVIESSNSITKLILQTHVDKTVIPYEVVSNIRKYAPEYQHLILNDAEASEFLKHYYHPKVLERFNQFTNGAHKADILRYALLYVYGGVYLDIKTELIRPLRDLFDRENTVYTVISSVPNSIYQGIIATPPKQEIFLTLIEFMLKTENPKPEDYLIFTIDLYNRIRKDVALGSSSNISVGLNVGKDFTYFLYQEICSSIATDCYDGLDRYGVCCYATNEGGERVIKIRRSSYPWHKKKLGKRLVGPMI